MSEVEYVAGNPRFNGSDRLVILSGCSSGGKSTLLAALGRRGFGTVAEPGRQVVREQVYADGTALPWLDMRAFLEKCLDRSVHAFNVANPGDGHILFDRSIIDALCAFDRLRLPMPPGALRLAELYRYAPTVYLVPPWEELFRSDSERQHGFNEAVAEYDSLLAAYRTNGYRVEILPRTSVESRADLVESAIRR